MMDKEKEFIFHQVTAIQPVTVVTKVIAITVAAGTAVTAICIQVDVKNVGKFIYCWYKCWKIHLLATTGPN